MKYCYTPGPWAFEANSNLILGHTKKGREPRICKVHVNLKASKANAQLISAAPQLLKALIDLCALQEYGDVPSWVTEWDMAFSAIAAATELPSGD